MSEKKQRTEFQEVNHLDKEILQDSSASVSCKIEVKPRKFSLKQFLFGSSKRTIVSSLLFALLLLGIAGFIVGMLIIKGDIQIDKQEVVTGYDGEKYNYTTLKVKPEWSLDKHEILLLQPVSQDSNSTCYYYITDNQLVTIQQCRDFQKVMLNNEKVEELARNLSSQLQNLSDLKNYTQDQFYSLISQKLNTSIQQEQYFQVDSNGEIVNLSEKRRNLGWISGVINTIGNIAENAIDKIIDPISSSINQAQNILSQVDIIITQVIQLASSAQSSSCQIVKEGSDSFQVLKMPQNCAPLRIFGKGQIFRCNYQVIKTKIVQPQVDFSKICKMS